MEQQIRVLVWGLLAAIVSFAAGLYVARLERPVEPGSHHVAIIVASAVTVVCSLVLMCSAASPRTGHSAPSA